MPQCPHRRGTLLSPWNTHDIIRIVYDTHYVDLCRQRPEQGCLHVCVCVVCVCVVCGKCVDRHIHIPACTHVYIHTAMHTCAHTHTYLSGSPDLWIGEEFNSRRRRGGKGIRDVHVGEVVEGERVGKKR